MKNYLYIFYLGHDDLYKIGITNNWERRIKKFSAVNPWIDPTFIFEVPDKSIEDKVHQWLKDACVHVNREIFSMSPGEVELTANYIYELGGVEA